MMRIVSVADLMERSEVAFGTSGARGKVSAMTDMVCFVYTCAFLQHLQNAGQFTSAMPVAIAGDLRPSTPRIIAACAAAIHHMGETAAFCGFVPSPAVAAYGFAHGIPSLMVTGSHIPDDRNGIKFNRVDGEVLKTDEMAMRAQAVLLPDLFDEQGMLKVAHEMRARIDVETSYVARYVEFFGPRALQGLKLGVYEHSAVGRDLLVTIIEQLGGQVVRLGRSEKFIPVDTEAVRREDQVLAQQWAAELNLDAILSTDGDSDRPLLADETGAWMRGDVLGLLCAQALGMEAVATPVSCNSAVERSGSFKKVRRTRIGSPYVVEAMNALTDGSLTVCGYEANGGFLLGTRIESQGRQLQALPTRDAVLPMVAVLVYMQRRNMDLSALQAELPARYTFSERLEAYPTEQSKGLLDCLQEGAETQILARLTKLFHGLAGTAITFDTTDGLRTTFEDGDIIHLRPSGNAPELRCYTESDTPARAAFLNERVLASIRELTAF